MTQLIVRMFRKGDSLFAQLFSFQDIPFLVILQAVIIFLATLLAMISFWKVRYYTKKEEMKINRGAWYVLYGITILYSIVSIIIIV